MMYGQGKSDSPIVPMKSPNNAAPAAAEAMEGRGGAKGNGVRGSTCQTQSWESVSPALDRIRETARRDKRVRFTALLHHVTVDLLRWSFYQLQRRAAAGIDGVTWDQYETGLEGNLADLHGRAYDGVPIGRSRRGVSISPSPTAGSGRWASPRWRTRSSSGRWWKS